MFVKFHNVENFVIIGKPNSPENIIKLLAPVFGVKLRQLYISKAKLFEQQSQNDEPISQKYGIRDYHNSATDG